MENSPADQSRPGWWFDEFVDHQWLADDAPASYSATIRTDPAVERELLTRLGLEPHHTLIDFGAGTGPLVLAAAGVCARVIAVDPSEAMLQFLRAEVEQLGVPNVELVHAGVLTYKHEGEPANFVVTRRTLHHLPDFWKVEALRRIYDVLTPGGTFYAHELVYSFEPPQMDLAIEAWIDGVARGEGSSFPRAFFEEHVREKYSTYSWLFEAMLEKVGFVIRDASYRDSKAYAEYVCVKRAV